MKGAAGLSAVDSTSQLRNEAPDSELVAEEPDELINP